MPELYPYEKRNWYPHMMPEDVAVWERFIDANPTAYLTVSYDVPVGSVPDFVKVKDEDSQRSMERLYKKKIDVVATTTSTLEIIELKPQCSMSTIGQVKGYLHLYVRDMKPEKTPQAVVICAGASEDVKEYAIAEGVRIIVV